MRQLSVSRPSAVCAICERTLLDGRAARFASRPTASEFVDVCPLCQEIALEHGWVKEGSPTTPDDPGAAARRRRAGSRRSSTRGASRRPTSRSRPSRSSAASPSRELAMVEAADLFNASDYRRTVGGIAKSLGEPRVEHRPLSGVNPRSSSPSPGTSPGTSTASRPTRPSRCGWPSAATSSAELEGAFKAGTPASTRTAARPRDRAALALDRRTLPTIRAG